MRETVKHQVKQKCEDCELMRWRMSDLTCMKYGVTSLFAATSDFNVLRVVNERYFLSSRMYPTSDSRNRNCLLERPESDRIWTQRADECVGLHEVLLVGHRVAVACDFEGLHETREEQKALLPRERLAQTAPPSCNRQYMHLLTCTLFQFVEF